MGRRRIRRFGALLATTALAVLGAAAPADAVVANPGPVDIYTSVQVVQSEVLAAAPMSLPAPLRVTVGSDGTLIVPREQFVTNPVDVVMNARGSSLNGDIVHLSLEATSDLLGLISPENQTFDLAGTFAIVASIDGKFSNCAISFAANPHTPRSGEVDGAPYTDSDGHAILVDKAFVVTPLLPSQCNGYDGSLNRALDLPSAPGDWTLAVEVLVAPPVSNTTPTTTTTATTQPTTTGTTTPATGPAAEPGTTAPSSSGTAGTAAPPTDAPRVTPNRSANGNRAATTTKPTTTVESTTTTSTRPELRDNRSVIPPLLSESGSSSTTAAPAGAAEVRIPDSTQPVSNSVPTGVLAFAVALLLGGIGIALISAELRKARSTPKRRLN